MIVTAAKSRIVYQGDTISDPAPTLSRIFQADDLTANALQQKMRSMADLQTIGLTQSQCNWFGQTNRLVQLVDGLSVSGG